MSDEPDSGEEPLKKTYREDRSISDALHTLDIIDAKVGVLIQFVGILIAAVLIFISGSAGSTSLEIGAISLGGFSLISIALALLSIAALISLSCVWIINMQEISLKEESKKGYIVDKIHSVTRSRRTRYKIAFVFTFMGLFASIVAISVSLAGM